MRRVLVTAMAVGLLAGATALASPAAAQPDSTDNAVGAVPQYGAPTGDAGPIETVTTRIGPISLDAMGGPHWEDEAEVGIARPDIDVPGVPWYAIRGATFDVVDAEGVPVPRHDVHLHHFVLVNVGQEDPACPARERQGFKVRPHLASGAERTPIALPDPYAYKMRDDNVWGSSWHVMNMTDEPAEVFLEYTIAYQPGRTDANTRWVDPWFLDVEGSCGGANFDVPGDGGPGSVHDRSLSWTVPEDGLIVGTGGHLHEGGIATELRRADDSVVCRSVASYVDGHPVGHGQPIDVIWPCATHHPVAAGEELSLHALYDNSMPYEDVMGINLTFFWFGDQGAGLTELADVGPDHPFRTAIEWALAEGVTTGYDDGTFRPGVALTRQALVAFLWRLAGQPAPTDEDGGFSDVPPEHPFWSAVTWARQEGVVGGYPDGTFRGGNVVSRQALVAFLWRQAGQPAPIATTAGFTDVGADHPFRAAITWAAEAHRVEGYEDDTFRPADPLTRQAGTAVLARDTAASELAVLWDLFVEWWDWTGEGGGGGGHPH